ncbi:MAG: Cbb3-type cytochrome c oxidase subunit CcoN1 [Verrucomicrobia subdivision 3 bacterium]|nr:Cbb3-type cytochrome c oxidase subunit CcoN1 [Limisphaerales bacterium]MCS1415040.1 Cbb3-type cytochrome c oxidase subunit CcoN1 [Limisphaerales bacterium]
MSEPNGIENESGAMNPGWEAEIPVQELDRSCRVPVTFMFGEAAGWLFLSSLFALLNSVRFHAPDLLAHCPWLTFGRIQAAANVIFIYGFALQSAFAVALWLLVRMGRNVLVLPGYVLLGAVFWNVGVLVGVVGILAGEGTAYELFEIPKYASPILFVAYAIIGGLALVTFQRRQVRELYVSQWFLFVALLWFPWIFSTASLLLHFYPVRGVAQVAVAGWYATGLKTLVLGGVGLSVIFYLIPKLLRRSLHSHHMAVFAFWLLLFFGNGAGVLSGTTVPSWISALSATMTFFVCFATVLIGLNLYLTVGDQVNRLLEPEFRFVLVSLVSFLLVGVLGAINAHSSVAALTQFTLVLSGFNQLVLGGFIAMGLFGIAYYLLPRILGTEWPNDRLVNLHFWVTVVGLGLTIGIFGLGGLIQGQTMNDASIPFAVVTKVALNFIRMETVGSLLLAGGSLLFLVNVGRISCQGLCCGEEGIELSHGRRG